LDLTGEINIDDALVQGRVFTHAGLCSICGKLAGMTSTKLPSAPKDSGKLSEVLISLAAAISPGESEVQNLMGFSPVRSAVCVLIDGLGLQNLKARSGHAPNLTALMGQGGSLRTDFPSTTVVSLTGLATGQRSGGHGLAGYNLRNPETLQVQNLLSGWESIAPGQLNKDLLIWKSYETISEILSNVRLHVVSKEMYRSSGFTKLTMPNAVFSAADDFDSRVAKALELGKQAGNLVYLYFQSSIKLATASEVSHMSGAACWSRLTPRLGLY